jgi:hypothetical protein
MMEFLQRRDDSWMLRSFFGPASDQIRLLAAITKVTDNVQDLLDPSEGTGERRVKLRHGSRKYLPFWGSAHTISSCDPLVHVVQLAPVISSVSDTYIYGEAALVGSAS